MIKRNIVIIGGGAAGLAAAISAYDHGEKDILIIEQYEHLGGILGQCIHSGFGLQTFKEELTGPEYAYRFEQEVLKRHIEVKFYTRVIAVTNDHVLTYSNPSEGVVKISCGAIIFATGSYKRPSGHIAMCGDRVSGIITAGSAQRLLNINGGLVGKRVIIIGSGDIGLIMARRLTLEGAKVLAVCEIMPYSNGLNRNISQCLNDFNIPLYLSTTVKEVKGKSRVEKVILCKVDENKQMIPGSEIEMECDTLLLSIGLLPQITLLKEAGAKYIGTRVIVNEYLETSIPGIFACGNSLHIHDIVDLVSKEGALAGENAVRYINSSLPRCDLVPIIAGKNIGYVMPNFVNRVNETFINKFRVSKPLSNPTIILKANGQEIKRIKAIKLLPSIMQEVAIDMKEDYKEIIVEAEGE